MFKILVCINDDLLKLRIKRILSEKNFAYTITDKPIKRDDLLLYEVVLIHSSYRLPNLFQFIENAVISNLATFLYISTNINSNPFRRFQDHINIIFIDEHRMDVEIPLSLDLFDKYSKQIIKLNNENQKLKDDLKEMQLMNRCKRQLMQEGYSEDEAHKHILKFAMDHHIDKIEACNRLLNSNSE